MFFTLPQTVQHEIQQLAQCYGQPLTHLITLRSETLFDPLNKKDRYGEVCMVIRRKNDHLLTMTKTYYPQNTYRLLTGGIHHHEHILDALLRETAEETSLTVQVKYFLAIAAYQLAGGTSPIFYTFAFLLDEIDGTLATADNDEEIAAFREILPDELPLIAERLAHIGDDYSPQLNANWHDWGQFRSVIHSLARQALIQMDAKL
jgi:8-oxo-dGTP pyrophosphatase MutT (NUDIX family)